MATGGGKAGAGKERPTRLAAAVFDTCPSFSDGRGPVGELICIGFSVFARSATCSNPATCSVQKLLVPGDPRESE